MSKFGTGNMGHYRGVDALEQIRLTSEKAQAQFIFLRTQLNQIIGEEAFDQWVEDTWPEGILSYQQMCDFVSAELERYECSCTPDRDIPCSGCQAYFAARENRVPCAEIITIEGQTW